jgi:hypothetical protein
MPASTRNCAPPWRAPGERRRHHAGTAPLPEGLLLAYYGDDFTGSTDTMEVMTFNGLPTVLFVEPPTP